MNYKPLILTVLAFTLVFTHLMVSEAEAVETSITPIADSYVSDINPSVNYGGSSALFTYYYQYDIFGEIFTQHYVSWLKFDLSKIPKEATVKSIVLRIHTFVVISTNQVGVFLCNNNSWTELGITWSNMPSTTSAQQLQTISLAAADQDYDLNITAALEGKSMVSLVFKTLQSTSLSGSASFYSREGLRQPKLFVNYSMPSNPIDTNLITGIGVLIAIAVLVTGTYLFRKSKKKGTKPQAPIQPPQTQER